MKRLWLNCRQDPAVLPVQHDFTANLSGDEDVQVVTDGTSISSIRLLLPSRERNFDFAGVNLRLLVISCTFHSRIYSKEGQESTSCLDVNIVTKKLYMDWDQVRSLFPAALKYTYLNTAAAPPLSEFTAREGKRYNDEMSRLMVEKFGKDLIDEATKKAPPYAMTMKLWAIEMQEATAADVVAFMKHKIPDVVASRILSVRAYNDKGTMVNASVTPGNELKSQIWKSSTPCGNDILLRWRFETFWKTLTIFSGTSTIFL